MTLVSDYTFWRLYWWLWWPWWPWPWNNMDENSYSVYFWSHIITSLLKSSWRCHNTLGLDFVLSPAPVVVNPGAAVVVSPIPVTRVSNGMVGVQIYINLGQWCSPHSAPNVHYWLRPWLKNTCGNRNGWRWRWRAGRTPGGQGARLRPFKTEVNIFQTCVHSSSKLVLH